MLNSLVIKNFRMLEDFKIEKLGRVNLIVGKNNSGKSTVLEALRIYADEAHPNLLEEIAESHDEKYWLKDEELGKHNTDLPFKDLFSNWQFPKDDNTKIIIGENASSEQILSIQHVFFVEKNEMEIENGRTIQRKHTEVIPKSQVGLSGELITQALFISKNNRLFYIRFTDNSRMEKFETEVLPCEFIPTQFISIDELASEWDKVVYTEYEKIITDALKIILPKFEHLVFVQNERSISSRIAKIKLADLPRPVPLKSLGDGMLRILQIAIKLVSAQSGFLLIDEFENGLHYSVQEKVWSWLFEIAEKLDIQVFATTHSRDCIQSFNKVAIEKENIEAVLFRMGKSALNTNKGQVIATVYDKERLYNLSQIDIEVR